MKHRYYGKQTGEAVTREIPTPAGGVQLETFIPFSLVKRGPKKGIVTPIGAPLAFQTEAAKERAAREAEKLPALTRALGLAFHWQRLLDERRVASTAEIAEAEGMNVTQVRRILRLTHLAPQLVERWTNSPDEVTVEEVTRRPWPADWSAQMRQFGLLGQTKMKAPKGPHAATRGGNRGHDLESRTVDPNYALGAPA